MKFDGKEEPNWLWISARALLGVAVLVTSITGLQLLFAPYIFDADSENRLTAYGVSGDLFGFSNAIISGFAFALFVVTLVMQRYELSQQRKELEITRQVFEQQKAEMAEQNESLRRQRFDNTFFNMLELHSQVVTSLRSADNANFGRPVVDDLLSSLRHVVGAEQSDPVAAARSIEIYEEWYGRHEREIGHYFRTLYNILRFVRDQKIKEERTYVRLVRAQLSSSELELLLYNGLGQRGRERFKPLIEKYSILKHLPAYSHLVPLREEYEESAFVSTLDGVNG